MTAPGTPDAPQIAARTHLASRDGAARALSRTLDASLVRTGGETSVVSLSRILRSYKLERVAQRLRSAGEYEAAVLVAQTLLELRVEAEMANFVSDMDYGDFGEAALASLPNYNLVGRTLKLAEAMAGSRLRDDMPLTMDGLQAHIERRNGVAHRGEEVTAEDAAASLEAVAAVTQRLHELFYLRLGRDDDLAEEERIRREEQGLDDEDDWP